MLEYAIEPRTPARAEDDASIRLDRTSYARYSSVLPPEEIERLHELVSRDEFTARETKPLLHGREAARFKERWIPSKPLIESEYFRTDKAVQEIVLAPVIVDRLKEASGKNPDAPLALTRVYIQFYDVGDYIDFAVHAKDSFFGVLLIHPAASGGHFQTSDNVDVPDPVNVGLESGDLLVASGDLPHAVERIHALLDGKPRTSVVYIF